MYIDPKILQWKYISDPVMVQSLITLAALNNGDSISMSIRNISNLLNLSLQRTRTLLDKLQQSGVISIHTKQSMDITQEATQKATQKVTHISFCKYVGYDNASTQNTTQNITQNATQKSERFSKPIIPLLFSQEEEIPVPESPSNNNEKKKTTRATKSFVKPSVQEVQAYINESASKNGLDPSCIGFTAQKWMSYYESNGWLVGNRKKMKDWKRSVLYWLNNTYKHAAIIHQPAPSISGNNVAIQNNIKYDSTNNQQWRETSYERNKRRAIAVASSIALYED